MCFPKPLGMQNGEVLKDKTKKTPCKRKTKSKAVKVETWMYTPIKMCICTSEINIKQKFWNKDRLWQQDTTSDEQAMDCSSYSVVWELVLCVRNTLIIN